MLVLTEDNFQQEVLHSDEPVLVDFWGAWCRPCHSLMPTLDKLSGDYKIGKVNVDEQPGLLADYKVSALPTLIFFKDGKEVDRLVGLQTESVLRSTMEGLCG